VLAIGLAIFSAVGFGSAAIFARLGMQHIRPVPSTLISSVASFFPTALLALIFALSDIRALPPVAMLWFLGHGALTFLGGRAQNHMSINLIGASRSGPFIASATLFAAIFATTITEERLSPLVALGTVAVVGGLLLSTGDIWRQEWQRDRRSLMGYALALGAAASYGGSNLVAKELSLLYGSPLVVAAFSLFFGITLLTPIAGRGAIEGVRSSTTGLGFTALSGLAAAAAVISLYFAFQRSDVVIISPISSANPLVTLFLAHFFLERLERVTLLILSGTVLTVLGVVLVVIGSTL